MITLTHEIKSNLISKAKYHKIKSSGKIVKFFKCDGIGFKVFEHIEDRDFAFRMQKRVYKKGLAPCPYVRYTYVDENGEKQYGYFTELAKTKSHSNWKDEDVYLKNFEELQASLYDMFPKYDDLWVDFHDGNVGMIKNKPVWIDFSI